MIASLNGGTVVKGLLLDRHVAVSNMGKFRKDSLEIGRTLDYDYYIGLYVRPPYNSTVCETMKKCVQDIVQSKEFELQALKVCHVLFLNNDNNKQLLNSAFAWPAYFSWSTNTESKNCFVIDSK